MTHPAPEQLGAYLDGELDAAARAGLDAHLRDCAECAALLSDLASIDDAARTVPLVAPEGYFESFAPRVRARLEQRTRARWRPPVWGWAAAAALMLGVVTPLVYRESARRTAAPEAAPRSKPAAAPSVLESADRPGVQAPPTRPAAGMDQDALTADRVPQSTLAAPAASPPAPAAGRGSRAAPPVTIESRAYDEGQANASQEERLARRDRAEAGAAPAAPPPLGAARAREEPAKRQQDKVELQDPNVAQDERAKLKEDDDRRALGYTAPPPPPASASGQRQHGPRSQGTVAPPPTRKTTEAKAAEASNEKEQAEDTAPPKPAELRAGTLQESVTVVQEPRDLMAGAESVKFRSLARSRPRSDGEARALREEWRTFASAHPDHPQVDEARVRLVEAGVLAYRLGRRPQDRETALRDGRDYLERGPAPQADRVRTSLKSLDR